MDNEDFILDEFIEEFEDCYADEWWEEDEDFPFYDDVDLGYGEPVAR